MDTVICKWATIPEDSLPKQETIDWLACIKKVDPEMAVVLNKLV